VRRFPEALFTAPGCYGPERFRSGAGYILPVRSAVPDGFMNKGDTAIMARPAGAGVVVGVCRRGWAGVIVRVDSPPSMVVA